MKKLFLLFATALVGFNANAQLSETSSILAGSVHDAVVPNTADNPPPSAKSSIAGGRWYHHAAVINDVVLPGQMIMRPVVIWFDSTVTQNFTGGPGTINWSSLGQVVDPIHFTLYNNVDASPGSANEIAITMESDYEIDSIAFGGYYVEVPARPEDVVDTFIFSVSTSGETQETPFQQRTPSSQDFTNNGYVDVGTADTIIKGFRIVPSDSINRASGVSNAIVWKVPIDTSFRRPDSAGYIFYREYVYPVMVGNNPGSLTIPAGRTAAVTVTFKSGDVSIPGDSVYAYHHMFMRSGEGLGGPDAAMPYFHYEYRDENMSNMMFSTAPDFYAASVIIEGHNTTNFRQEFHDIAAHLYCANCPTVAEFSSVHNVNSSVGTDMVAYPNPANSEINVSFYMNQNTSATVSISNAVGQVIATQEVANVQAKKQNKVTFSTASLAPGIYFYTVEAKGQRTTDRFVVTH